MTEDPGTAVRMSALFDPEPETWDLRGDPRLWRALREHLAGQAIPPSAGEVTSVLHAAFHELAGAGLTTEPGDPLTDEIQLFGGGKAVDAEFSGATGDLLQKARDPNHEELVEI